MNKVDLTILRLAVYELKWDDEIPVGVAINEAVELAKEYDAEEAASFINGVLGAVARAEFPQAAPAEKKDEPKVEEGNA